jgi:Na+-exporting ATPase
MVAHKVWIPDFGMLSVKDATNILDLEDAKLSINGVALDLSDLASQSRIEKLKPVLDAIALCNFASVFRAESDDTTEKAPVVGVWKSVGDPTEVALQVLSMRFGRGKDALLNSGELSAVMEHQFDSNLKRMSMAYKNSTTRYVEVFAKGASESILPIVDISEKDRDVILQKLESLASEGLRVLCIATKTVSEDQEAQLSDRKFMESHLKLQGLVGLYDPPRLETFAAVKKCHGASIKVHMLTGDHLSTATAIAKLVGILDPSTQTVDSVMRAQEFDKLSDAEIDAMINLPVVLARCSPQTKVRMVEALARRKAFSVMTGDGVNDAPALKHADVGIAMGINGTDVAKDAADMVLTDDNFASIVKAVEEGRRLFDNIQKVSPPTTHR